MLEPDNNPNPSMMVDPPRWLRHLLKWQFKSVTDPARIAKARAKAEQQRQKSGEPHIVEYFHSLTIPIAT